MCGVGGGGQTHPRCGILWVSSNTEPVTISFSTLTMGCSGVVPCIVSPDGHGHL